MSRASVSNSLLLSGEDPTSVSNDPPMGFGTLRRLQPVAATYTRLTSPGCAAPSGFLSLATLCSATDLSTLFHVDPSLGFNLQRFSPPSSRHASRRALSSLSFTDRISPTLRCEFLRPVGLRGLMHLVGPFQRSGFTRSPSADPLLTVYPPRSYSSELDSTLLRNLLSWAFARP